MRYFVDIYPNMDAVQDELVQTISSLSCTEEEKETFTKELNRVILWGYDEVDVWLHMQKLFNKFLEEKEEKESDVEECIA